MATLHSKYGNLEGVDAIDHAIAQHWDAIVFLSTRRNESIPIWRIPDEILSRIMSFLAHEHFHAPWDDRNAPFKASLKPYGWTSVLRVCRRWNRVALATREVWAYMSLESTERTRTCLQLSGRAPLTIFHSVEDVQLDALRQCLAEMDRIHHIRLHLGYPLELLGEDASHLPPPSSPARVASLSLNTASPRFTKLFVGPCLTHLSLKHLDPWFEVEELVALLDSTPSLAHLELEYALESAETLPPADVAHKVVHLPALRHLIFNDDSSKAVAFTTLLQSIQLPSHTDISVDLNVQNYRSESDRTLANVLQSMTRSIFHGRIPPSSCRIYHEQRRSYDASKLGIDLWHEICAAPTAPDAPSTLEEVMQTTIKVDVRDSSAGQIFLDALLASLPLADVSGLGLHLPSEYLSSLWLPFAVFTRVSQLVVSPHPLVYSLFAALAPSPPDRASNTLRGQYPCSPSYLR